MDKGVYLDYGGASQAMHRLAVVTNNLANANTIGFRQDNVTSESVNLEQTQNQSRTFTKLDKSYSDFTPGPITYTGRDLDVAIKGEGFFVVQGPDGKEGYTRAGDFELNSAGRLQTRNGGIVLGMQGVINIPNNAQAVNIGSDGTVSVLIPGQTDMQQVGQIKFAKPDVNQLMKGDYGLFHLPDDAGAAPVANDVTVTAASLEGSNVNPVVALTQLIDLSRNFEFHMNTMKTMQDLASKSNELLDVPK